MYRSIILKSLIALLSGVLSVSAMAHEWTPTYPKLSMSYMENVWTTRMKLFNSREGIDYYDVSVFDQEWNAVPFAVLMNPMSVKYLETKYIDIYIRDKDKSRAVYICSKSKLYAIDTTKPMLFSRICSKIK
jgi:hypothetical protein